MLRTLRQRSSAGLRRGSALVLVLLLTVALGALAISAIFLTSNASILGKYFDREREFKYAAEAAMMIGKSRLIQDTTIVLQDTGYVTLMSNATLNGADGLPVPGTTVNLYAARTGNTTGQFGLFASIVADARDPSGSRFVRRLELQEENFAKFAYWSNSEKMGGTTIWFAPSDAIFGPVWSNDTIRILPPGGSRFLDDVGTAKFIVNKSMGIYGKTVMEWQRPIKLPSSARLVRLPAYAASGNLSFNAPTTGNETTVELRIEFVMSDLNADGDSTDADEGFLRVYRANAGGANWLRGDYRTENCGDFHPIIPGGVPRFFPDQVHNGGNAWFTALLVAGGMSPAAATAEANKTFTQVMATIGSRCFAGGDPRLVSQERAGVTGQLGGTDTTFTPNGSKGQWLPWPGAVDPLLAARRPYDAAYLFPLFRGQNPGVEGVIYVNGTVAVSGQLRGRVTLYSSNTIVILDDLRYATDPASGQCGDMLGIIAADNSVVADNGINTPVNVAGWRTFDDSPGVFLHSVVMTLNTSFRVQNYNAGPNTGTPCGATQWGRGCLSLTGGLIQQDRGAVGTSGGTGYLKRYSYDRCMAAASPPYFPTTGRYLDNRYYEIDPVRFNVASLFASLRT